MADTIHKVTITDVDIPFWSMVGILIKWAIAAIPAILIVSLLVSVVATFLSFLFGFAYHEWFMARSPHY